MRTGTAGTAERDGRGPGGQGMERFVTSDGVPVAYVVDDYTDPWRRPATLVLLHAAMGSSRRLYRWVPILARHYRVVRPDLRCHGETGLPPGAELGLGRLARDVVELADHLGGGPVHLAGSSAGAIVAMQVAIDHPERVLSVANFAAPPGLRHSQVDAGKWVATIRGKGLRRLMEETIHERFDPDADPAFLRWFIDEACRTDGDLLCRFVQVMAEVDQLGQLPRIRCPLLAVVPEHDPLCAPAQYALLREHVADCRFVVYSDLPHNITDAVPERCAEELARFLGSRRFAA